MTRTPAAPSAYAFSTALPPPGIPGPVTSAIFPLTFAPAKSFWPFARAAPPTTAISASADPLPDRPPTLSVKSTRALYCFAAAPVRLSAGIAVLSTIGVVKCWKKVPPSPHGSRPISLNRSATYPAASRYPGEPV